MALTSFTRFVGDNKKITVVDCLSSPSMTAFAYTMDQLRNCLLLFEKSQENSGTSTWLSLRYVVPVFELENDLHVRI